MTTRQRLRKARSRLQHRLIPGARYLRSSRLAVCPCCRRRTVIIALSPSDEFRVCVRCRGGLRYWMLAEYLRESVPPLESSTVLELDARSPLRHVLGASHTYIRSYWSPTETMGTARPDGARCEDISRLTMEDESLDLIVSSEVLEHVPDLTAAMQETERVLRRGGRHVFTVPVRRFTRQRARLLPDGTIEHLMPPEYHSDPLSPERILAYWDVGTEDAPAMFSSPQLKLSIVAGPTGRDGRIIWCAEKLAPAVDGSGAGDAGA